MAKTRQLVWFRTDIRAEDNKALYQASQAGDVVGVYLIQPGQWANHDDSPNKLFFSLSCVASLQQRLAKLNIPLLVKEAVYYSDSAELLLNLARSLECQGIWFNDEYGVNEQNRDRKVIEAFDAAGLSSHRFTDAVLVEPGRVMTGKGEAFKVFTPFKKAVYRHLRPEDWMPCPSPSKQTSLDIASDPVPVDRYTPTASNILERWEPDEASAHKCLNDFIESRVQRYAEQRDFPALDGTSSLSPWLVAGVLSIRQCFDAAVCANNGELDSGNAGITCWLGELVWREFYKHILVAFPRVSMHRPFQVETDKLSWRHDSALQEAWESGKTGFPLVDAAMRQLVATGWMHNRLRMVTAMFLSKNLMLDWRIGERFFMRHLVDGDLAANNGGWQWSASTGTDAAPYFRMFNPVSQSEKFDPDGTFIRTWVPELAALDNKAIHQPLKGKTGDLFGALDYPAPIVDHSASRQRVIEAFKGLRS
ncbi:deoxyribodipyrimidine photo-lyase [Kistimonas scapharcae]|uniref:Deoxyribodipyrimidine photo-lyase n=1 Tax=Kistimonas scapharcae TaxID=1036133 RepID=A0ABP8UWQ8_9GAMM